MTRPDAMTDMTDRRIRTPGDLESLSFWENGLLPVVSQDADTGRVLMVAFAHREALEKTLETGEMHYWSRSRQELWHKGATSGNYQALVALHGDCDSDTVLARVRPLGPACHTGEVSCFGKLTDGPEGREPPSGRDESASGPGGREGVRNDTLPHEGGPGPTPESETVLPRLWEVMVRREQERPRGSYTVRLLEDENLRLKKLGEETAELLLALAREDRDGIVEEAADLVYHLLAALLGAGVGLEDLLSGLENRRR